MLDPKACSQEQDVLDALQSGRWSNELRAHFADCSDCADLAIVAGALRHESEVALEEVRMPSASFVWWKSKLRARREAEDKVLQPVRVAEKVGLAAAAAALGGLTWWLWPVDGIGSVAQSLGLTLSGSLVLGSAAAFLSLVGFAVYALVAKE